MTKILLILTFFLFSLGQLGRVSFFNQQVNFYLYEVLMGILLLFYFLKLKFTPLKKLFDSQQWIFWGFIYLLISFFVKFFDYSLFENLVSFLYLLRLFFYFLFFTYLYFYYQKKEKKDLVLGFLIFSFLTIVFSFVQFFLYPNLRNLAYLGWDVHQNRVFGVFFDTSVAASIYGLFFLFWLNYKNTRYFWLLPPLFLLLYFTYSRFVIFSFFLTLFLFFLKKSSLRYFFITLVFLIFLLIFFPQKSGVGVNLNRFFSIEARIKENILGIEMGLKDPLLGIGYNRIRFFRQKSNLLWQSDFNIYHGASSFQSTYVTLFVATGVVGVLFFGKGLIKLIDGSKEFFYLIFFIAISSLADNLLLHPFLIFILGMAKAIFDKKP
jgi:hypothetical protein